MYDSVWCSVVDLATQHTSPPSPCRQACAGARHGFAMQWLPTCNLTGATQTFCDANGAYRSPSPLVHTANRCSHAGPCQGRVRVRGRAEPIHGQFCAQAQRDGAVHRPALLRATSIPLPVEAALVVPAKELPHLDGTLAVTNSTITSEGSNVLLFYVLRSRPHVEL